MPHFTQQITPIGPLVEVLIGVSEGRQDALIKESQKVPLAVRLRGLVDTGAGFTCVDSGVLTALNLEPKGTVRICTPSTGEEPVEADEYDVSLKIPPPSFQHTAFIEGTIGVAAAELAVHGFHVLIGRDVLRHFLVSYNGQSGFFTLAY